MEHEDNWEPIGRRIEDARIEFLKRSIEPDSLYLGRNEMLQLKLEIEFWEVSNLVERFMVHGLHLHIVNEESHFAVAKTKFP